MTLRTFVLIGAVAVLASSRAAAQHPGVRPSASVLFRPAAAAAPSDTLHLPETYWKEGALITGIPSAVFGGALAYGFCGWDGGDDSGCGLKVVAGAVLFGLIGAIPGALIGGQFDKPR